METTHYLIFNANTLDGFVEYVDQYGNFFMFETEEEEVSRYIGDEMFLEYEKLPSKLIRVYDEDEKDVKFNGKFKFL